MINSIHISGTIISIDSKNKNYYITVKGQRNHQEPNGEFKDNILTFKTWRGLSEQIQDSDWMNCTVLIQGHIESTDEADRYVLVAEGIELIGNR